MSPEPDSRTWHPGEASDDVFLYSEATLTAYARGDQVEGDHFAWLAHDAERAVILRGQNK